MARKARTDEQRVRVIKSILTELFEIIRSADPNTYVVSEYEPQPRGRRSKAREAEERRIRMKAALDETYDAMQAKSKYPADNEEEEEWDDYDYDGLF